MSSPDEKPETITVPKTWQNVGIGADSGLVTVLGGTDTGKSTFVRYLFQRLVDSGDKVCILDGDPGQSWLGPPACLTLGDRIEFLPPQGQGGPPWRRFVGAVTPQGHMLPMLTAAAQLIHTARQAGYGTILYDTCGYIDPQRGGLALKLAELDLLQPEWVVIIQDQEELAGFANALLKAGKTKLTSLKTSPDVISRQIGQRQAHRRDIFRRFFKDAHVIRLDWNDYAVRPVPRFSLHRLLALENQGGELLGLGIILTLDRIKSEITLLSSLKNLDDVRWLHLGDLYLDPGSFQDRSG